MAKRRRPGVVEPPSLDELLFLTPVKKRARVERAPESWSVDELADYLRGAGLNDTVTQAFKSKYISKSNNTSITTLYIYNSWCRLKG